MILKKLHWTTLKGHLNKLVLMLPSQKKRLHVQPAEFVSKHFMGFSIRKGFVRGLESELKSCSKKLDLEIKLIDLIEGEEKDCKKLVKTLKISNYQVKKLIQRISSVPKTRNRKIQKFVNKITILEVTEKLAEKQGKTFRTVNDFSHQLLRMNNLLVASNSSLYKILHLKGWKCRAATFRAGATLQNKDARIWFFDRYLQLINDDTQIIIYFDWSSFSEKNFQRKLWTRICEKPITKQFYMYAKLHLLCIISRNGKKALSLFEEICRAF